MISKQELNFSYGKVFPYKPPVVRGAWQPREIACGDCGASVMATAPNTTRCKPCQQIASARVQVRATAKAKAKRKAKAARQ